FSLRDSAVIGALMNTRGLTELIVLNIGLDLGLLSTTMFTMLVIMALVTTFMAGPALRLLDPRRELSASAHDALRQASPLRPLDQLDEHTIGRPPQDESNGQPPPPLADAAAASPPAPRRPHAAPR